MSVRERIFHSVLFESIALVLTVLFGSLITGADSQTMTWVAVSLSLMAMTWNYVYNLGFDHIFGMERDKRSLLMRIGHGIGFEGGLVLVTIPFLMWALGLEFWKVLALDIGLVLFFLVYAIVYNWCYDTVRKKLVSTGMVQPIQQPS